MVLAVKSFGPHPLARHWLFSSVSAADLAPVIAAARTESFLPGDVVFHEGDPADGLYVIASGEVRLAVTGEGGRTVLTTLGPEDVFGEMGVLDGVPRSATATVAEVATLYFVPTAPFLDLLRRTSAVSLQLLPLLTARLRQMNGRISELPVAAATPASGA